MFFLDLVAVFYEWKFLYILQKKEIFSIITSYKLIILKYTEEDVPHLQHPTWTSLLPTLNC